MVRIGSVLAVMFVASGAATPQDDLLRSAACREALQALEVAEAASAPPTSAATRLAPARQRAARACLGGRAGPPPSQHLVQPPVRVAPLLSPAPALPALPALPNPPPAVVPRGEPPTLVLGCNESGCWTSDGLFMPRSGSSLFGPRGWCRVQGATLLCP